MRKRAAKENPRLDRLTQKADAGPELVDSEPLLPVTPTTQKAILFVTLCAAWLVAYISAFLVSSLVPTPTPLLL